jgi:tetraacyldisaccharide 4'-kinase
MPPSVAELVGRHLASRLWDRWFDSAHPNPWKATEGGPVASRLQSIRQRRARVLSRLLWWLIEPLLPLAARLTSWVARRRGQRQCAAPRAPSGTAIAIGNWIPGGTGKTPVCIALALALVAQGRSPAILTRGYRPGGGLSLGGAVPWRKNAGGRVQVLTYNGLAGVSPTEVGDEAWLMAWRSGCPVGVGADRFQTAQAVHRLYPATDIWILDDGLSQTSLRPDRRVLMLDARGHGNGRVLPDGPLRGPWPPGPALAPDAVIAPEQQDLRPILTSLAASPLRVPHNREPGVWLRFSWGCWPLKPEVSEEPPTGPVLAIAGIAQPEEFFEQLRRQGLRLIDPLSLSDHANEILPAVLRWKMGHPQEDAPRLVMTEKDAVKFAWETRSVHTPSDPSVVGLRELLADFGPHWWVQRLAVHLPNEWITTIATPED